ncbi:hypothetical protein C8J57DRAFT_1046947 [Mycena rebaudengoi]|nr:hypothetical protein C8J57DRAFT_1046947 [Mycena rebaudengoi]
MNQSSSAFTSLAKGRACVNCRRRKVKCDGSRPICGPCSRCSAVFGDCEYTDAGPSHGQLLEEQISILQARIDELEKSKSAQSSTATRRRSSTAPSQISPSSSMQLGPLLCHFCNILSCLAQVIHRVHNFLHNASCFGFFLDTQAFHDAITDANSRDMPPVLLNVMYLWGVHISKAPELTVHEPAFLENALRSTAGSLTGSHPRTILHSIQASVLLAYYFIWNARFLEGRYHISAAVSIALSSGLHKIRAESGESTFGVLAPPKDVAEEGERISALWSVLNLNNCWAGTDGSPSNISYGPSGLQIDTPWPIGRRIGDYAERAHLLPVHSSGTVLKFLTSVPDDAESCNALYAKATILFEQASSLSARYRSSKPDGVVPLILLSHYGLPGRITGQESDFTVLDARIEQFKASLPPVQTNILLVIHSLTHVSTIRLHKSFANDNAFSRNKTISAARSIVDLIGKVDVQNFGIFDPVLAVSPLCLIPPIDPLTEINVAIVDLYLPRIY